MLETQVRLGFRGIHGLWTVLLHMGCMKWQLAIIGSLWMIGYNGPAMAQWSLAAGYDPLHAKATYVEARYYGARWAHWTAYLGSGTSSRIGPRVGAELYQTWLSGRLTTGLGVTLASRDSIVATPLRYQLRLGVTLKHGYSLELVHESNCKSACDNSLLRWIPRGPKDKANLGYTFITLRKRFR